MAPRAFKVQTAEGSTFLMRLDPVEEVCGRQFGRLRVIGKAVSTDLQIDWTGNGACEPAVGGEMIVHPKPVQIQTILGETVESWQVEHITYVREIPVPPEIVDRLPPVRPAHPIVQE